MEWKKYDYPPGSKMTWNTWHLLSLGGAQRLGEITQVDPTMDVYDAYGFRRDGRIHHGKGNSGLVELGRFRDRPDAFEAAKAAVESFVATSTTSTADSAVSEHTGIRRTDEMPNGE